MEAIPFIQKIYQGEIKLDVLDRAYQDIASRSKTLVEFAEISMMYLTHHKIDYHGDLLMLSKFVELFVTQQFDTFDLNEIKTFLQEFIISNSYTNESVYSMLRLCLTGLENTPNVCNIMYALGYQECLARLIV
jgi:hypothetical protein